MAQLQLGPTVERMAAKPRPPGPPGPNASAGAGQHLAASVEKKVARWLCRCGCIEPWADTDGFYFHTVAARTRGGRGVGEDGAGSVEARDRGRAWEWVQGNGGSARRRRYSRRRWRECTACTID